MSSIKRDSTQTAQSACENFLYGFKAARRAARAANAASLSVVVSRQPVRVAFGLRAGSFAAGIAELL